jgi:hypothetical protein
VQQSNLVARSSSLSVDLVDIALGHPCARHELFNRLRHVELTTASAGALLRNYDAHACVLRRLLLRAAAIMPEEAVGYILENVRTEFGAGNVDDRHQLQLVDLAHKSGVRDADFKAYRIESGVKQFVKAATRYYYPANLPASRHYKPAICAGAITATEVLAIEEFKALQIAFSSLNLQHHIWFDHVEVEVSHSDDSLALAHHFMAQEKHIPAVLLGLNGVLDATVLLYDGLLAALNG